MPKAIPIHRPKGKQSKKEQNRQYDARRREDDVRKMYQTPRWRNLRTVILDRDPYCVRCLLSGVVTPSTVANHITKAKDEPERFYDETNLEGVCAPCHNSDIQKEERANARQL